MFNRDFKEYVAFSINEAKQMAEFLAVLIKEGITYRIAKYGENYHIILTGF